MSKYPTVFVYQMSDGRKIEASIPALVADDELKKFAEAILESLKVAQHIRNDD